MTPRRARSTNLAFLAVMILTVLVVAGGTAYVIHRLHNSAVAEALDSSSLHARAFEDQLTRSLATLQRLADFIAAGPADLAPGEIDDLFHRTLRQAPFLRSLSALDDQGRILASSNPANVGGVLETGEYFPPAVAYRTESLRIGRPWTGRDFDQGSPASGEATEAATGLGFVPVLCAGEHGGRRVTLVAALNPDFFLNYFSQWLSADAGFVDILRYDRMVLLSSGESSHPGAPYRDSTLTQRLQDSEIGHYQSGSDAQRPSFAAFRASRQFPLLVVTHHYREHALAQWRQESRRLLLLVGPALLGMLVLTTALYRRERRMVAEQVEAQRRDYERLAATVFETIHDGVMVTNPQQVIIAVNPAFTRITGYSAAEAMGATPSLLASGYHSEDFFEEMRQTLTARGHWEGELRSRRKNGEVFIAGLSINLVRDDAGQVTHQVTGFSDITDYRAEADRIAHLAHHDLLTGLPNRALLTDRLRQALHQAQREQCRLALVFFDLDRFKPVNDRLGHAMGDRVLQTLATRLQGCVRAADTLARLGGDEFVVLLPVIESSQCALVVAEKIRLAVQEPILLDQHLVSIASSLGIVLYPDHAADEEDLLWCADQAMYQAKASGGNRIQVYQKDPTQPRLATLNQENRSLAAAPSSDRHRSARGESRG
ncbi:MAG: diguanylate cyclase domain-containing protein [Trichloromonadaceae bacterium]